MRADSGFYTHSVVSVCCKLDVRFSITIRQHKSLRLIEAIPEADWTSIPYWMDGAADVAETTYPESTASGQCPEAARRCSCESGIMVLKRQTDPRKGAPNRCYRNHPDRIQIAFDDHRLVANAGLLLPVTLAHHLGLSQLQERLDLGNAPGRANTGDTWSLRWRAVLH